MNSEPSPLEQLFLSEAKWALLKAHGPSIGDLASEKYGANSPLHTILPTYLKKKIRQFDLVFRPWTHPLDHSI
jgi:hypothetical protein